MGDVWEVYAVKYGTHEGRRMSDTYMGGDPHDTSGRLAYFVWALVNGGRTYVVDTGFGWESAERRGRKIECLPREGLARIGVDAAKVEDVIITHLHFDHAGTLDHFPNARLHLQDSEMEFATGRCMCHQPLRMAYDVEDVCTMVRRVYAEQVTFHGGDRTLTPGISVHHIGGHAKGLMSVRVKTARGWVVLASDAAHFYINIEEKKPFPILYNLGDMMEGWNKLYALSETRAHMIPGHDPLILERYPAASAALEGQVACMHMAPKG